MDKNYMCFECTQTFSDANKAIQHLKSVHNVREKRNQIKCIANKACEKYYFTFSGLRSHVKACIKSVNPIINVVSHRNIDEEGAGAISEGVESSETFANEASHTEVVSTSIDELSTIMDYKFHLGELNQLEDNENDGAGEEYKFIYDHANKTKSYTSAQNMSQFLDEFNNSISQLDLKQSEANSIFKLCDKLTKNIQKLNITLITDDNKMNPLEAVETTTDIVCNKLSELNSTYKRNVAYESKENYVKPKEVAIGTRWELKKVKRLGRMIRIPRLIQCSMQHVSIIETIKSLFKCEEFRNLYFNHNSEENRNCLSGKYTSFCCGKSFKDNQLFRTYPNSLQIQIASDGFEICNPLQSKANRHNVCAVYFRIMNLPIEYLSKLKNIYLICLCNSNDIKTKRTDFNNIWQLILNEVKWLETVGIDLDDKTNLKGTITTLAFDNLGSNTALGFAGGFNTSHYCRICECSMKTCQKLSKEDRGKLRTINNYDRHLETIEESEKVDYSKTKGIKYYCVLSNLNYFHIIKNPTVDIMHDINEGAIPFLLVLFFKYCIAAKVFTLDELNSLVQYYDYGYLNKSNIPSFVNLTKRSLGQNAAQSKCLFQHLPFILYKYRHNTKLLAVWECIEALLRITEIAYSYELNETDLNIFEAQTFILLDGIQKYFNAPLIPKLHFLLHYVTIIRLVGPLVLMNMFRFESKHKILKKFAEKTQNFKNINKTLAIKHQQILCCSQFTYKNDITSGVICSISHEFRLTNQNLMKEYIDNYDGNIFETKFLKCNNYKYKEGILILHGSHLFQIHQILISNDRYYFMCKQATFVEFNSFLNSFKVEMFEHMPLMIIDFQNLKIKRSFEIKSVEGDTYIIADTLELRNSIV